MARPSTLVGSPPHLVRFVPQQQGHGDCAVASLAMLCGVDWPTAFAAFDDPASVLAQGVAPWAEFRHAASRLGIKTRVKRRPDLHADTGILYCTDIDGPDGHAAFLWAGRIIDGDGRCYLFVPDYLRLRQFRSHSLLMRA
jgi:hypothetical protein